MWECFDRRGGTEVPEVRLQHMPLRTQYHKKGKLCQIAIPLLSNIQIFQSSICFIIHSEPSSLQSVIVFYFFGNVNIEKP